jgi:hypothetical protein
VQLIFFSAVDPYKHVLWTGRGCVMPFSWLTKGKQKCLNENAIIPVQLSSSSAAASLSIQRRFVNYKMQRRMRWSDISVCWIHKDVEGSGGALLQDTLVVFTCSHKKDGEEARLPSVRMRSNRCPLWSVYFVGHSGQNVVLDAPRRSVPEPSVLDEMLGIASNLCTVIPNSTPQGSFL